MKKSIGHSDGQQQEAKKGHIKGMRFEHELYEEFFAPLCIECDDDPALVARTPGNLEDCKTGDLISTLGESTGAPGINIVIEAKDREVKLKDARMSIKARTIQKSGKLIEDCANELKEELDRRVAEVLKMLRIS